METMKMGIATLRVTVLCMILLQLLACGPIFPRKPVARLGKGWIGQIAYSPDGELLAVASSTGIWLYDAGNLEEMGLLIDQAWSLAFSTDGKILASGGGDKKICLWDIRERKLIGTLEGHKGTADWLAFSPDGEILASACHSDEVVRLWDVRKGKLIGILSHGDKVEAMAFSPNGETIATVTERGIHLWDAQNCRQMEVLDDKGECLAFSPDGKMLASARGGINLWDVDRRERVGVLREDGHGSWGLAFSPDGRFLASGSRGTEKPVCVWDVQTQKLVTFFQGHEDHVRFTAFTPDGETLASASWDGTVRVWDIGEKKQIGVIQHYMPVLTSIAFSPDGRILACAGGWDGSVHLWDVGNRRRIAKLKNFGNVSFVTFSPDGRILASPGILWDVQEQKQVGEMWDSGYTLVFSPDGKTMITGGYSIIRIWDVYKQEQIGMLRGCEGELTVLALNPDGNLLVSGCINKAVLWDIQKRKQVTVLEHEKRVNSAAFSPDGKLLAHCSGDIHLWDVHAQQQVGVLHRAGDEMFAVTFSPDGKYLASGCENQVILWDVRKQEQTAVLEAQKSGVKEISFSSDGRWLAVGGNDGSVLLWEVNISVPPELAPDRITRAAEEYELTETSPEQKTILPIMERRSDVLYSREAIDSIGQQLAEIISRYGQTGNDETIISWYGPYADIDRAGNVHLIWEEVPSKPDIADSNSSTSRDEYRRRGRVRSPDWRKQAQFYYRKINADGTLAISKKQLVGYADHIARYSAPNSPVIVPCIDDSVFILWCYMDDWGPIHAARLDSNGDVIWRKCIYVGGWTPFAVADSDNHLHIVHTTTRHPSRWRDFKYLKLDPDGRFLMRRNFHVKEDIDTGNNAFPFRYYPIIRPDGKLDIVFLEYVEKKDADKKSSRFRAHYMKLDDEGERVALVKNVYEASNDISHPLWPAVFTSDDGSRISIVFGIDRQNEELMAQFVELDSAGNDITREGQPRIGYPQGKLIQTTIRLSPSNVFYLLGRDELGSIWVTELPGHITNPSNGHRYQIVFRRVSWQQAKAYAESMGGYLATIASQQEQDWAYSTFGGIRFWLGGTDENTEGEWQWVNGEKWGYTYWGDGEPNNRDNEDALVMYDDGHWRDAPTDSLSYPLSFLVEFDSQ